MCCFVSFDLIKMLRDRTGIGIFKCKQLLLKYNCDINYIIKNINSIIYDDNKKKNVNNYRCDDNICVKFILLNMKLFYNNKYCVVIKLSCETDFVLKNPLFINFSNELIYLIYYYKIVNINFLNDVIKKKIFFISNKFSENISLVYLNIIKVINYYLFTYLHNYKFGVVIFLFNNFIINKYIVNIIKKLSVHILFFKPVFIDIFDYNKKKMFFLKKINNKKCCYLNEKKSYEFCKCGNYIIVDNFKEDFFCMDFTVSDNCKKYFLYDQYFIYDNTIFVKDVFLKNNLIIDNFYIF